MTKLHEAIVVDLVDANRLGRLPGRLVLADEMELAVAHGVSRTAAREAMQKLASLGLIQSRRRKGATVLARESWKCWMRRVGHGGLARRGRVSSGSLSAKGRTSFFRTTGT